MALAVWPGRPPRWRVLPQSSRQSGAVPRRTTPPWKRCTAARRRRRWSATAFPIPKRTAVPNATPICANARFAGKRTFAPNPRNQRKTRRRPNAEKKERILSFQKKKRQRAIAEARRKEPSIVTAGGFAGSVNSAFTAPKKAKEAAKSFFSEHKGAIIGICVAGLLFGLFALALSSGASLVQGSGTTVTSTTYVSTDAEIYAVENAYCALEDGLNAQVNAIPSTHPGYDDYEYQIDEIEHNPYYLISYLQVKYGGFTCDDTVKAEINRLFRQQYALSVSEKSETRTRLETVTEMRTVFDADTGEMRTEPFEYETNLTNP